MLVINGDSRPAERRAVNKFRAATSKKRSDGDYGTNVLPFQEGLDVTKCIQRDRLDIANRNDFDLTDLRESGHDIHDTKRNRVWMHRVRVDWNRHQYARRKAGAAQIAGQLEDLVVGVEILDQDGVTRGQSFFAHEAPRNGYSPPPARQPHHDDDQHQQSDPKLPRGPQMVRAVDEVLRPMCGCSVVAHEKVSADNSRSPMSTL